MSQPDADRFSEPKVSRVLRVLASADVSLVAPAMLVRGWVPRGAVTVLAGQAGEGKGITAADLVARGSRGDKMPNGDRLTRPFSSLIVCGPGEDGAADWKLRLTAANADPQRWRLIEATADDLGYERPINSDDLLPILDRAVADGIELVVIDSLGAVAGDIDVNKAEVRDRLLNHLANHARRTGLAVLLIHHVRKSGGDALTIVSGSAQIVAACRSVLVIVRERDDENDSTRFLVVGKLNGARKSDPVAFTTTGHLIDDEAGERLRDDRGDLVYVPAIQWLERTVTNSEAAAAMAGLPAHRDEAANAMRELLAAGPMRSPNLEAEMAEAGYSKAQTQRARERIGAAAIKIGKGDHAGWWTLRPGTPKLEGRALVEQGSTQA